MKTVQRAMQVLAAVAGVMAFTPVVQAKAPKGFYLGVSTGQSTYDLDQEEFDDIVLDTYFSGGAPVLSGTSTFEDGGTSLALIAGYRFLPYVAVELSYLDLGTAEYRSTGTINPIGPVTSIPAATNIDVTTQGFSVAGIGSIPIGEVFDLHGRLGLLINSTDIEVTATRVNGNGSGTSTETLESAGAFFGLGAAFHIGNHFSLSLDWTKYLNVGDENEDEDFTTTEGFDIDALSLSAIVTF